jgi:pyruvate formate lyase activating enzyme
MTRVYGSTSFLNVRFAVAGLGPAVQRVEILPFHRLGVPKYAALGRPFPLAVTPTPSTALVARTRAQFQERGLPVLVA